MQQNNSLFWLANRIDKQNKLQFGSCNQKPTTRFRRRSQFQHRSTHRILARMNNATRKNFKIGIDSTMDPNPHKKRIVARLMYAFKFSRDPELVTSFRALGTDCMFSHAWYWLQVSPRLTMVVLFPTLETCFKFLRTWHRLQPQIPVICCPG